MKSLRGKRIKLLAMLLMIVLLFSSLRTTSVNADVGNDNNEVEDIELNEDEEYVNQIQDYIRDLLASQDLNKGNIRSTILNTGGAVLTLDDKSYYADYDGLYENEYKEQNEDCYIALFLRSMVLSMLLETKQASRSI